MKYSGLHFIFAVGLSFLLANVGFAQQIPRTQATTLTGAQFVVPKEPPSSKPLLLVLSFSHKADDDLKAWNKHYKTIYENDSRLDYYELADFQGVPSFVMKFILHGMRKSVQEPERSHFAPFYSQEQDWKKLVGYSDPELGYLVLTDGSGHVLFQIHGPASDAKAQELEASVEKARTHTEGKQ